MSNFEQMSEAVLVSLEKLGPSSPKAIAADTGIKKARLQQVLAQMLEDRSLKAAGVRRSRVYALPAQDLAVQAAPARDALEAGARLGRKKPAKKAKRVRKAKKKTKRASPRRPNSGRGRRIERRGADRPAVGAMSAELREALSRPAASWVDPATPARSPAEASAIVEDFNRKMDDAIGGSFGRLRIAFVEHLAAITDMQRRLFGVPKAQRVHADGSFVEPLTGFGSEPEQASARGNGSAGAH